MKILRFEILIVLFSINRFSICQSGNGITNQIEFDSASIKKHVQFLASDSLQGRGTGSFGENLAAEYIAAEFAEYGLKPLD